MGMEIVEVIMRAEEEFEIEISDEEATELATVGQLYYCILGKVNYGPSVEAKKTWNANDVWPSLQAMLVDELTVKPEALTMETDFVRDLDLG